MNTSAGKDSSAALAVVVAAAEAAGVRDRLVMVHADLGESEWPGTGTLATSHAARYGLPLEVVARRREGGGVETILERVAAGRDGQGGKWPDAARRWCTSDHKRGPGRFCVLASRADLICSARLNPELAAAHAAVESDVGHRFRLDLSMAEVIAAAERGDGPESGGGGPCCGP
ncbi:hypothetical protein [Nocardia brasiliensis]|uniref:hypothetical protein n=1 Tax=Nocardia brasiliensis TaxID=37326 RepID=UPI00245707BB|nr:hypothetical protein [Nocardia brasiliensis]